MRRIYLQIYEFSNMYKFFGYSVYSNMVPRVAFLTAYCESAIDGRQYYDYILLQRLVSFEVVNIYK